MIIDIITYVLGGAVAGLLAGLLGIGGGLLVVPLLAFVLPFHGIPASLVMHMAVATSLSVIVGTSISSIIGHHLHGDIDWQLFKKVVLGLAFGALLGAHVADAVSGNVLRVSFGLFVFFLAFKMAFGNQPEVENKPLPKRVGLVIVGFVISFLCTLLGMGGGSLMVPYLTHRSVPIRRAVSTSAVCGFPIAFMGVLGLMFVGSDETGRPIWSAGYVYWPAFVGIVIPSVIMAPVGAKLSHHLPAAQLRKIFSLFLVFIGIDMLSRAFLDMIHWF